MSHVGTVVLAKRSVVPEDVVALSVFPFACFGWFVLYLVVCRHTLASAFLLFRVPVNGFSCFLLFKYHLA